MKYKKETLTLSVLILLVSFLNFNVQTEAAVSDLQVNPVPGFSGQMCSSAFTSNGTFFVGDNDYTLYRSDDNGSTYRMVYRFPVQPSPSSAVTGYLWTVFIDSRNYIFVSIPATNRLYRSTNWGATFQQVLNTNGTQNDGFYIAMTEDSQRNLYAATYCNSISPQQPAILKSTNGGSSWFTIRTFGTIHLHNIKFNSYDGYLYVATGEWTYGYNNSECERIFRSKDYGQTWRVVVDRPVEMEAQGSTVYLPILFQGRWVYLGSDQAFQPNWIDRFYDDGSSRAFSTQRAYNFPSDSPCPVLSGAKLNDRILLFASTPEFYNGITRVVASEDGVNWQIIKETALPQWLHHTNFLTINPRGLVFCSDGPGKNYVISEGATQPTPTPTATPTPTPTPLGQVIFEDHFESGNFNSWTTTGGGGTHSQTIETANPHHGSYNAKITVGASSEGWAQKTIPPSPTVYLQQYVKLASLPPSGSRIYLGTIQNTNSDNNVDVYVENQNGQYYWGLYASINGVVYHDREMSPSNPQANVYYCVESMRDVTNARSKLWVDGVLKVDTVKPHIGNANRVYSGITYAFNTATLYVDCVKVSTSYIGPESTTPTSTPTPTATPTPTPTPTVTPTPTPTDTPTPTPTPTTYLFMADFENGNFNEYTTVSGVGTHKSTIETANPYRGNYNAKFIAGANSESWASHAINSSPQTYSRALIKLENLPPLGSRTCLGSIQNTNWQNTVDPFIYNSDGQYYWGIVSVINGVFYWDLEPTPSNPQAGTYYTVEFLRDVTNHKTSLWIDGTLKVDVTRNHVGNSNLVFTGISWSDSTITTYVDCVRIKTTYIGPES